jgi:hypothetical protein
MAMKPVSLRKEVLGLARRPQAEQYNLSRQLERREFRGCVGLQEVLGPQLREESVAVER